MLVFDRRINLGDVRRKRLLVVGTHSNGAYDSHGNEHHVLRSLILAQNVEQRGHHAEPDKHKDRIENQ